MDPMRELGRGLLILGLVIAAVGTILLTGAKLPMRLGRLPGDIVHQGRHTTIYIPIATCIVLSVLLTLGFWIMGLFRR